MTAVISCPNQPFIDTTLKFASSKNAVISHRRYISPGKDVHTAVLEQKPMRIYDARPNLPEYTMDSCGFQVIQHKSQHLNLRKVDARTKEQEEYFKEMEQLVKDVTGAIKVIAFHSVVRSSSAKVGGDVQEPAADVHCDYNTPTAVKLAAVLPQMKGLTDFEYDSFYCINIWRPLSDPENDWPLAFCQASTANQNEKFCSIKVDVDSIEDIPDMSDLTKLPPLDDTFRSVDILYEYEAGQRWNYVSGLTRDETIFLKQHDSENPLSRAPHTAFDNTRTPGVKVRESVELRCVAYFKKGANATNFH